MGVNILDLFSGIGGFALGLEQAKIKHDWLGYSDINEYSNKIYRRHFDGATKLGDITTIQTERLPKVDLVTFGFPCQDLSVANKGRKGLDGDRSSLFFEAIRIIRDKKPKYFIFENVKGTFNSNNGADFKIILESIADIGYDGQWQLLNTRWFLPQNRGRIYFIGYPRGQCPPKIFPLGTDQEESDYRQTQGKTTTTVKPGWGNLQNDASYLIEDVKGCSYRTRAYKGKGGAIEERSDGVSNALNTIPKDYMVKIIARGGEYKKNQDHAACLTGSRNSGIHRNMDLLEYKSELIRRFTPLECERLQGFPDNWTDCVADTRRYQALGNAVSVPVVKSIGEKLLKYLI